MLRIALLVSFGLGLAAAPVAATDLILNLDPDDVSAPGDDLPGCGLTPLECEIDDIELVKAGVRALLVSYPSFDGTGAPWAAQGRGPFAERNDLALIDAIFTPLVGQQFSPEQAALSWNYLVALSFGSQPGAGSPMASFDETQPLRLDGCSLARPHDCWAVQQALAPAAAIPEPGAAGLFALAAYAVIRGLGR